MRRDPPRSGRLLAAAVVLAALGACAPQARADAAPAAAERASEVGTEPRLRSLRFDGVRAASRRGLEALLATPIPPRWWQPWAAPPVFVPGSEAPDAERIGRHYRTLGYFETTVTPELRWSDDRRAVELTFQVREGEPVRLVERGIEIAPALLAEHAPDTFLADLPLAVGDVFSLERYDAAKKELLARLAEIGRPLATVAGGADVDVPTREARLTWRRSGSRASRAPTSRSCAARSRSRRATSTRSRRCARRAATSSRCASWARWSCARCRRRRAPAETAT